MKRSGFTLIEIMLVVITKKMLKRGFCVGQEVGYGKDKNKTIIPLVGKNVHKENLGVLGNITPIIIGDEGISDSLGL